jgi:hypothetical protein
MCVCCGEKKKKKRSKRDNRSRNKHSASFLHLTSDLRGKPSEQRNVAHLSSLLVLKMFGEKKRRRK